MFPQSPEPGSTQCQGVLLSLQSIRVIGAAGKYQEVRREGRES